MLTEITDENRAIIKMYGGPDDLEQRAEQVFNKMISANKINISSYNKVLNQVLICSERYVLIL